MKKITTLDIEASGLSPDSYPIEVGIVLSDGSSWCSLIQPIDHWRHWSEEAESLHHISHNEILQRGKNISDIAGTLNHLLGEQTVYSDCCGLDDGWLQKLYREANRTPSFRLRDIVYLLKEEQFDHWESTKERVAQELQLKRHRATNDARILQEAFFRISTPQFNLQTPNLPK
ncbi:MAG: hypothetical protein ACI9D5_000458 [Candidatus Endobugula sp.]|jgi:hypothetical protein